MICQTCKQPLAGLPFTAYCGVGGATWYWHRSLGDCVRALLAARRQKARAA